MYGVEGRENTKAEKNEKQRSKEENRNCSAKKVQILACTKVKYCTFLHEIFLKILLQYKKAHFWQSLGKFSTVAPKKSI